MLGFQLYMERNHLKKTKKRFRLVEKTAFRKEMQMLKNVTKFQVSECE